MLFIGVLLFFFVCTTRAAGDIEDLSTMMWTSLNLVNKAVPESEYKLLRKLSVEEVVQKGEEMEEYLRLVTLLPSPPGSVLSKTNDLLAKWHECLSTRETGKLRRHLQVLENDDSFPLSPYFYELRTEFLHLARGIETLFIPIWDTPYVFIHIIQGLFSDGNELEMLFVKREVNLVITTERLSQTSVEIPEPSREPWSPPKIVPGREPIRSLELEKLEGRPANPGEAYEVIENGVEVQYHIRHVNPK